MVNGVRVDPVAPRDLTARIETFLRCGGSHVVHFCPADPTVLARRDPVYREILNGGDLNLPDGMAIVWALRLLGHRAERIAGSDGFERLCAWGVPEGRRHYLFGGSPEVVERLPVRLQAMHPGIRIVGSESPPFRALSDEEVVEAAARIRASGPDLLWVGLGTPKQDLVAERLREAGAAPVILCVGAAFDFLSGAKKRAPLWMQRAGLEWAHRLASEPRRLWRRYAVGNPLFLAWNARDLVVRTLRTIPATIREEGGSLLCRFSRSR